MAGSFKASIDKWVLETKARQEAVFKNSAEAVSEEVIDFTPWDTGFLRASLQASLVEPPAIDPNAKPVKGRSYAPASNYSLVIENSKLGDTIYFGFVAAYAIHVEYGARGRKPAQMVGRAVQRWPQHVAKAVRDAKAAVRRNSAR